MVIGKTCVLWLFFVILFFFFFFFPCNIWQMDLAGELLFLVLLSVFSDDSVMAVTNC